MKKIVIIFILLLSVFWLFGIYLFKKPVENKLTAMSEELVTEKYSGTVEDYEIKFDGRDGYIYGNVATKDQDKEIVRVLEDHPGIRQVHSRIRTVEAPVEVAEPQVIEKIVEKIVEKPIYIEVGNEVWNTRMADAAGIHEAIGLRYGKNRMFGYGLRVGSFADAFARALVKRNATFNYTIIVNGFGTRTTKTMLDGIDQYMADNDVVLDKSLIGVASTNYFYGGFKYEKSNP